MRLAPAAAGLSDYGPDDYIFRTSEREHWVETDWRNYRSRHFILALKRVEAEWGGWHEGLSQSEQVRGSSPESSFRPYPHVLLLKIHDRPKGADMKRRMQPRQLKALIETGHYQPEPPLIAEAMLERRGVRMLLVDWPSSLSAASRTLSSPVAGRRAV